MKYTKIIKRETKVMAVIVVVLLVLVLGASYALFLRVASSQNNQVVKTGTLQVSYDSTNGYLNGNTYPDLLPMSDENGLLQSGYSFSVKNTGNLKTEYTVYIYVDQESFDRDHSGESLFADLNSLRYNFRVNSDTNTTVSTIGAQTKVTEDGIDKYELYTGSVEGTNSQNNHVFRVWLDPSMATSNIGKYVYLKLEVQSGVDTTLPKCQRATTLHTENCEQTSDHCAASGYTATGSKGTTTITYGNLGTTGTLATGDAFDCDVNGDGNYDAQTERFYYVTDVDANTAFLIYYNDFVTSTVAYDVGVDAYTNGPVTAVANLPTTTQWSNVSLTNTVRDIKDETGTVRKSGFDYGNKAARLITAQEINAACGITVGSSTIGELDNCNYLMENTKYSKSSNSTYGTWTETARSSSSGFVWGVNGKYSCVDIDVADSTYNFGTRPGIEVAKSDISY